MIPPYLVDESESSDIIGNFKHVQEFFLSDKLTSVLEILIKVFVFNIYIFGFISMVYNLKVKRNHMGKDRNFHLDPIFLINLNLGHGI